MHKCYIQGVRFESQFGEQKENTIMKVIFEMMQNFIGRGMNVRVDFVGGIPMFSVVSLEHKECVSAQRSANRGSSAVYCG